MIVCTVCLAAIVIVCLGAFFFGGFFFMYDNNFFHLTINSRHILCETDEKFLSVALDLSFMRCYFHKFNDSDWEKFKNLSSLLSPAHIRLGGIDADRTFFSFDTPTDKQFLNSNSCGHYLSQEKLIISGEDWVKLNEFAQKSGLNLIIDLNVLLRKNSEWNSENAEALIKFSEKNSFPLDFQLGNEPNSFPHMFNTTIPGRQLAKDFYALRKVLNSSKAYKNSKLIGPDITTPKNLRTASLKFLSEFLSKKNVVDVASWHQYYLNGKNATLEDFINPETFDLLPPEIESVLKVVRQHSKTMPIWISETSSACEGGVSKLSNRFAASFLWLDKLGVAARSNMSVVIRQSLFKGNYALIKDNLTPTPDFWIAVLYKQLVGSRVLDVKLEKNATKFVRFYGHCLASDSSLNGSIVIYGMNLSNQTETFVPSGINVVYPVYSYIFAPEFNNLRDKSVLLNDQTLVYNEYSETVVQDMLRRAKKVGFPLVIPSYTIGFWILNETTESACLI